MNDEPGAAPEPDEPPPGRSRYEDFDLADLQAGPQQGAARPTGRRTPLLTEPPPRARGGGQHGDHDHGPRADHRRTVPVPRDEEQGV